MAFDWLGEMRGERWSTGAFIEGAFNVLADWVMRTDPPRPGIPPRPRPPFIPDPVTIFEPTPTPPVGFQPTPFPPDVVAPPTSAPPTPVPAPPPTTSVPDMPSAPSTTPSRAPVRPRPKLPTSVGGLLFDQWWQLWQEYMNPQPIPWPSRRERRAPGAPRVPTEAPDEFPNDELENICENYPELCRPPATTVRFPVIPGTSVDDFESPARPASPSARPSPVGFPIGYPFPYGLPGQADPYPNPYDFPTTAPAPGTPRAPARRGRPIEIEFPWPDELIDFNRPRQSPRSRPGTRRTTRPGTRPAPLTPQQPLIGDVPNFEMPRMPEFTPTPRRDLVPRAEPQPQPQRSDPCSAVEAEKKREQRKRRKECTKFTTKTIRVCAD